MRGEEIRREIETLVNRRDLFVRKLKSLIRSELELIELLEAADSDQEEVKASGGK